MVSRICDEIELGAAIRQYTLWCWSCAARSIVPTLEAARDLGWRRQRGRWTCPRCCADPLNAPAVAHRSAILKVNPDAAGQFAGRVVGVFGRGEDLLSAARRHGQ